MRTGLYAGTFDPMTLGHLDIIRRATHLVDRLVIGVAVNEDKGPLFSLDERVEMVGAGCAGIGDSGTEIVVYPFDNLLVKCANDVGATVIIRGLRAVADFEYEYQMVGMNRVLDESIETVFLMAEAKYQAIASKLVKGIARLDGDISRFVTRAVRDALYAKRFLGRHHSAAVDGLARNGAGVGAVDVEVQRHVERHRLEFANRAVIGDPPGGGFTNSVDQVCHVLAPSVCRICLPTPRKLCRC